MSYILDALRRADADRVRAEGQVPGLQAVLASPAAGMDPGPPRRAGLPAWAWLAGGLVLGVAVAAAVALWLSRPGAVAATAAAAPPVMPVTPVNPVAAPAVPAAAETPSAAGPQATSPEPPAPALPPSPSPVTPRLTPKQADAGRPGPRDAAPARPPRKAAAVSQPPAAAVVPAATAKASAASAAAPAASPAAAAPAVVQLRSVAALPAGSPPLSFGGSVYSSAPAQRLLIVNGQVLHEGDRLGADATLEAIGPRSAVLQIRGQRYEVPY